MRYKFSWKVSLAIFLQLIVVVSSFSTICARPPLPRHRTALHQVIRPDVADQEADIQQNEIYVEGLIQNLTGILDRWVITGSPTKRKQVQNILDQIKREAKSERLVAKAFRLAKRGGFPVFEGNELGKTESKGRLKEAEERKEWENFRRSVEEVGSTVGRKKREHRSVLSSRRESNGKEDVLLGHVDAPLSSPEIRKKSQSKTEQKSVDKDRLLNAELRMSELVASSGSEFDGELLGIGGLDDVLAQVKRRVWVPLAAPPILLQELGISPVRGLLLYGMPGCGKTLIARTIGRILSPCRPVTVVSGPELMDKFVGSSEQNIRRVFDEPPPVYDTFLVQESDNGEAMSKVALHVIILDEFDSMARNRGGPKGDGSQGEAGVARDSVVNQILAKMDGVDPLPVPTLVIGMTNKRSLIDKALLRPGRFEVQIEVPPPRTQEQRVSILKVHSKTMFQAGRLLVKNAPIGSPAHLGMPCDLDTLSTYDELLFDIASNCEGFSGASLAGVVRAAASHSLERAVSSFSLDAGRSNMLECVVTKQDLELAVGDVKRSAFDSNPDNNDEEANPSPQNTH